VTKKGPAGSRWMRASAVGIEMAIGVVLGLLAGQWADEKLGTDPWLTLLGLVLGAGVGFRALLALTRPTGDDE